MREMQRPGATALFAAEALAPARLEAWACPECCGPITVEATGLRCGRCHSLYPTVDGIPSFARQQDFYYGEVSRPEGRWLLDQIATSGYEKGVRAFLGSLGRAKAEDLLYYLFDERRTAWRLLVGETTGGHALDLGCGWGTLALSLAETFSSVTAMDLTMERLRFGKARAVAEGRTNIRFVRGGDTPYLPFPAGSFDLVVLNGVLEWVPSGRPGDPRRVQEEFLREVARVLTAQGQMYLAIENRLSYRYLLGWPEDHTGLRFGALLPRKLAEAYSRLVRGKPYRTYTYTQRGYRALLQASGFSHVACHLPFPDYREIDEIRIDPSGIASEENRRGHQPEPLSIRWHAGGVRRSIKHLLAHTCPAAFSIVATRGAARPTVLEETCDRITKMISRSDRRQRPVWRLGPSLRIGSAGAVSFQLRAGAESVPLIAKIPLDSLSATALAGNANSLSALHADSRIPEVLRQLIPRFLGRTEGPNCIAFIETACMGVDGIEWLERGQPVASVTKDAMRLLASLHTSTARRVNLSEGQVRAWLAPFENRLLGLREEPSLISKWEEVAQRITKDLAGCELPLVRTHGDFWIGNLLVKDRAISGVIDWTNSAPEAYPAIDAYHFILCLEKAKTGMRRPMAEIIEEKLFCERMTRLESDLLATYARSLGLSAALLEALRPLVWIVHCLRYWDRMSSNPHWFRSSVERFLQVMQGGAR